MTTTAPTAPTEISKDADGDIEIQTRLDSLFPEPEKLKTLAPAVLKVMRDVYRTRKKGQQLAWSAADKRGNRGYLLMYRRPHDLSLSVSVSIWIEPETAMEVVEGMARELELEEQRHIECAVARLIQQVNPDAIWYDLYSHRLVEGRFSASNESWDSFVEILRFAAGGEEAARDEATKFQERLPNEVRSVVRKMKADWEE